MAFDEGEFRFRHCVVASTWAFEAQGPGSIPGGGANAQYIDSPHTDRFLSELRGEECEEP